MDRNALVCIQHLGKLVCPQVTICARLVHDIQVVSLPSVACSTHDSVTQQHANCFVQVSSQLATHNNMALLKCTSSTAFEVVYVESCLKLGYEGFGQLA